MSIYLICVFVYMCIYVIVYVYVCIYICLYICLQPQEDHLSEDHEGVSEVYLHRASGFWSLSPHSTTIPGQAGLISSPDYGKSLLTDLCSPVLLLYLISTYQPHRFL